MGDDHGCLFLRTIPIRRGRRIDRSSIPTEHFQIEGKAGGKRDRVEDPGSGKRIEARR